MFSEIETHADFFNVSHWIKHGTRNMTAYLLNSTVVRFHDSLVNENESTSLKFTGKSNNSAVTNLFAENKIFFAAI